MREEVEGLDTGELDGVLLEKGWGEIVAADCSRCSLKENTFHEDFWSAHLQRV